MSHADEMAVKQTEKLLAEMKKHYATLLYWDLMLSDSDKKKQDDFHFQKHQLEQRIKALENITQTGSDNFI